ncbi:hypothetical protein F5B22DRAFT_647804 [Xylaria bambusicola]|uniref:uncharacterized protein n=1 Tax=Xylaria bambusicola TaxID=326684 RepID=UPI002007904C|nr:uncharacterized protein F5B22DRAFT_647804 [Xylaria bambusicola]KAI0513259.1 hypothetical protein F5B22DRAFT_647804 [Xylaria bambusicola]
MLAALSIGAYVCIASEDGRTSDLAGEVQRPQANWAFLTPSVASALGTANVVMLQTLVLGEVAVTEEDTRKWVPGRSLFNRYGVTEAAALNVMRQLSVNSHTWLTPVGAVGELVPTFLLPVYIRR